jgi:hypothetical protein
LFQNAINLINIRFDYNIIQKLPNYLFKNAKILKTINFNNNKIDELSTNIFPNSIQLEYISFKNNQIKEIPDNFLSNAKKLRGLDLSSNKIEKIPDELFCNLTKIGCWIDLSNNEINQYDFKWLNKMNLTNSSRFDFRFNLINANNDISQIFSQFFNENKTKGIKRIESDSDLSNRLFIFYFNKSTFKLGDDYYNKFEQNIKELIEHYDEFTLLDFFISTKDLDSFWILLFESYIHNLLKQNIKNYEFKFATIESLEVIFERNDLSLIERFFKNEISNNPNMNEYNRYVREPFNFYFEIDFLKCFKIISKNENEKMAIYLFKILRFIKKFIYKLLNHKNNENKVVIDFENLEAAQSIFENPRTIQLYIEPLYNEDSDFDKDYDTNDDNESIGYLKHGPYIKKEYSSQLNLIIKEIFEKNWTNLIESILDDLYYFDYLELISSDKKDSSSDHHILILINKSKNETFLNHKTTNKILHNKWKYLPRFIYYFQFLIYFTFIITYSLNIEYYNQNEEWILTAKWYSFSICLYFTIFEYLQLADSIQNKQIYLYISSFKNLFELVSFPLCLFILFLPNNSELKSSIYSITILLSYWILMMRLDKFHYIGKFVNVFGSIIIRSIPLFIIVLINLIGFVLSFRNRTNETHQMTYFINDSFSNSIFKSFELLVGGINTDNMGIKEFNSSSFINFFIYGCFIFMMTILFINIFTGISIDEIQSLIKHSQAEIQSRKIEYIFKIEALNNRYFKKLSLNFNYLNKFILFIKSKIKKNNNDVEETNKIFNNNKTIINDEFEQVKINNQITELTLQSKFEFINMNIKKEIQNLDKRLEKIECNFQNIEIRFDKIVKELEILTENLSKNMKITIQNTNERFEIIENKNEIIFSEMLQKIETMPKNIEKKLDKNENQNNAINKLLQKLNEKMEEKI